MFTNQKNESGFTLIEVLLSIALIAFIAGISIPVYQSLQLRNDLEVSANIISQNLRRAQTLSRGVDDDSKWGLYIESEKATIFKGNDFLTRDMDADETYDLPRSVVPSGLQEIIFGKFSGEPQQTGDVILTSSSGDIKTVTINEKGTINY